MIDRKNINSIVAEKVYISFDAKTNIVWLMKGKKKIAQVGLYDIFDEDGNRFVTD